MVHRIAAAALLTGAAFFCFASEASAQASDTEGFNLGLRVLGSSLSVEDEDVEMGGGVGLWLAYGVNERFTIFASADAASVEVDPEDAEGITGDWALAHADLGVRFWFSGSDSRWRPFVEAALGARVVGVDEAEFEGEEDVDVSFSGGSFSLGGGVAYYFSPSLALDVDLRFTSGEFTDLEVDDVTVGGFEIDADSSRLGIGLSWWP